MKQLEAIEGLGSLRNVIISPLMQHLLEKTKAKENDLMIHSTSDATEAIEIIENSKKKGHLSAVITDHMEDMQILRKADVKVCTINCTEQAIKEACNFIITSNVDSVFWIKRESAAVFSNLRKSITYTLSSNCPALLPFIISSIIKIPIAFTPIMILCVDLGTDVYPAISLAFEATEKIEQGEKLVIWQMLSTAYIQIGIISSIGAFIMFFYVFYLEGFPVDKLLFSYEQFYDPSVILNDLVRCY